MNTQRMKKQLSAAYRYSYSRLALNYYMFYESVCEIPDFSPQVRRYGDAFNGILKAFLDGEEAVEKLETLRNQVISITEVITAYIDCFQIYEYVLNRMERRFQKGLPAAPSIEDFTVRLVQFLQQSEDAMILNERIQMVVGQLPVRYTRQKFYSLVLEGLSPYAGAERKSLEDMLYVLRTESMVQMPEGMKEAYGELYESLAQLKAADYRHMDQEQYQACIKLVDQASVVLNDEAGIYMMLQDMINDLYVLFLAREDAMLELSEKQIMENMVAGVLDEFLAGNTSMVDDGITDMLYEMEGIQEHAMERYLSYGAPDVGETDSRMAVIDRLLSSSPFASLKEEEPSGEIVDQPWLEQQVAEFSRELDQVFSECSKPVTRAIMAKVLSNLPVVSYSRESMMEYVVNSLESCTDMAERETCMELLEQEMVVGNAMV